ncbi:MAG TPA: hypothetical protein VIZ63_00275 [Povalibacter sp.]
MDVAKQLQQVSVSVDNDGVIAFLEQMAGGVQMALNGASVSTRDPQHETPERNITHLHEQVNMVCHQAVGMQPRSESLDHLGSDFVKEISIRRLEEDVLAMVATQRDVPLMSL